MKRKAIVIMEDHVLNNLIRHSIYNPEKECGGFLFGNISPIKDGVIHCYVKGIYSEYKIPSTDVRFEFTTDYLNKAKAWGKKKNLQIIGIYHSHVYGSPAPTKTDLGTYHTTFPKEGLSIIYSPLYGINADFICRDSIIMGNDIYVKYPDGSYKLASDIFDHSNKIQKRGK